MIVCFISIFCISDLIKPDVPQILINREPLSHLEFDVELYGNCDDVIAELCTQLRFDWMSILEGFEHSPLNREKWKMFYDFCNEQMNSETEGEEDDVKEERKKNKTEWITTNDKGKFITCFNCIFHS